MKKLIVLSLPLLLTACVITGKGQKTGEVIKLAQEGLVCKTWEADLIRGGMNDGSGGFGTRMFPFTIENPALLEKVQYALDHGKEVKISYHHEEITFCRSENQKIGSGENDYDGDNFLDDIQIIN